MLVRLLLRLAGHLGLKLKNVFEVSLDGERFLVPMPVGEATESAIRVVQNWYEEFRDHAQE